MVEQLLMGLLYWRWPGFVFVFKHVAVAVFLCLITTATCPTTPFDQWGVAPICDPFYVKFLQLLLNRM